MEAQRGSGFVTLPVNETHLFVLPTLPRLHGDPFDRIIVAQARVEGLTLVTSDALLPRYGVRTIW
ncbi:MAG: type II toxin-antitoxin system VapC family toxin [Dehalococcoidia bacterium]